MTPKSTSQDRDIAAAYVAIEALNAWALFARAFYLSCALGAKTERKKRVTMTAPRAADHLGLAILRFKRQATPNSIGNWNRRDEPTWHDPYVLMSACGNIGCSIQAELQAALSLNQSVFKNLPVFRNFFAHRNAATSNAARQLAPQYMLPTYLSPAELLLTPAPSASAALIVEWLHELRITAEFMCRV